MESSPRPLLILSDSPSSTTGLGRICRDLATRIAAHLPDVFRVGTLGYGGPGSRSLPFPQYHIHSIDNWLVPELPSVWDDFAGDERGVLLTIWDPSRLRWLTQPDYCPVPHLAQWLKAPPFERWGYLPVDASGPNGKLTALLNHAICGFDRALCYSKWARRHRSRDSGRRSRDTHGSYVSSARDRYQRVLPAGSTGSQATFQERRVFWVNLRCVPGGHCSHQPNEEGLWFGDRDLRAPTPARSKRAGVDSHADTQSATGILFRC